MDKVHITDFDLTPVSKEFLKYAPAYAQEEAKAAIWKVQELQRQGLLRNGVYYVVLMDIVGATQMLSELGNEAMDARIQYFVKSSLDALNEIQLSNVAVFLKEIGDAVLFVFSHFPDVLRWHSSAEKYLELMNVYAWPDNPIRVRTVVHVGEVFLNGVNPLSLAVSQIFKIEKEAGAGDILLSAPAFQIAWPSLARGYHAFEECGAVEIEGYRGLLQLHRLCTSSFSSPETIANERHD